MQLCIRDQMEQLSSLLERIPKGNRQAAQEICQKYYKRMQLDIVYLRKAKTSDSSVLVGCRHGCILYLGTEFENLLAALRALEVEGVK